MKDKKPLYIPSSKKWKGLKVFCYKCKTNVYEICKETGKPLNRCPFGDKHAFKVYVHVPGTDNERKTKTLETRDPNQAIKEAMAFEKDIKEGKYKIKTKGEVTNEEQNKPQLLVHALARYVGFLNNEGVPEHRREQRTKGHINDVKRAAKNLIQSWTNSGHDMEKLTIEMINDKMVGELSTFLKDTLKYSNVTYNKQCSLYSSFFIWYKNEFDIPVKNWFDQKRVKRQPVYYNPQAISYEEFKGLLQQVTPENGLKGDNSKSNIYHPWLADGFRLALETGRRREEVVMLKFSGIYMDKDGAPACIKVEDFKVNRINKNDDERSKKYIYIPITNDLLKLLYKLGYEENKNTDKYILAPEITTNRERRMTEALSSGFTHYYKQLNTGRKLSFKCLRKTYITALNSYYKSGGSVIDITGHSSIAVANTHYIANQVPTKALPDFRVLSNEIEREEELEDIRNTQNKQQNDIER